MLTLTPKQVNQVCSFILDNFINEVANEHTTAVINLMRKCLGEAETCYRLMRLLLYDILSDSTVMYPLTICRQCGNFVRGGYECENCQDVDVTYKFKEMVHGMLSSTSMSNVLFKEPITINEDGDNEHQQ